MVALNIIDVPASSDGVNYIEMMAENPRKRFSLPACEIEEGFDADFTVFDPEARFVVEGEKLLSMGKYTPFEGWKAEGEIVRTVFKGKTVFAKQKAEE